MKGNFKCASCNNIFEAVGTKEEWKDPIYGPCFKYVAACPKCREEATEYRPPSNQNSKNIDMQSSACGCCSKASSCDMAGF